MTTFVGCAEDEPREQRGTHGGAQHAELGLLELDTVKRKARDQQGHREPDAGDRAAADKGTPADGET